MLLRRAFLAGSIAWAVAIPLAAFAASREGAASAVYGFALSVYAIGRVVCHQLPVRSFHLWSVSLPVCARCAGIYGAAAVTSVVIALTPRPSAEARLVRRGAAREGGSAKAGGRLEPRLVLLAALAPTAATLIFEWTTGVMPAGWIRALAGVPLGAAVAWAIGMVN